MQELHPCDLLRTSIPNITSPTNALEVTWLFWTCKAWEAPGGHHGAHSTLSIIGGCIPNPYSNLSIALCP